MTSAASFQRNGRSSPPIADEKLAVRTADAIERRILSESVAPATRIGSEAQLVAEYGVSRAVLREAILILEQRQMASRRRGVGGGVVARRPDVSSVARSVALYLECAGVKPEELLDARIVLEQHCARLAARSISSECISELRGHISAAQTLTGEVQRDHVRLFHLRLADMSGSAVWRLFVEVLIDVAIHLTSQAGEGPDDAALAAQCQMLAAVVDAIEARDAEAAAAKLSRYLEHVSSRYIAPLDGHP